MLSEEQRKTAEAARRIYRERLRSVLEETHPDQFVAVEPVSGDHFTAPTLSEAIGASRQRYPDRLAHAFRVGHRAAVHFGMQLR